MMAFLKEFWLWILIPFVLVLALLLVLLLFNKDGASPFVYNIF